MSIYLPIDTVVYIARMYPNMRSLLYKQTLCIRYSLIDVGAYLTIGHLQLHLSAFALVLCNAPAEIDIKNVNSKRGVGLVAQQRKST